MMYLHVHVGDHLYKQTPGLPLEDQMISSQPDLLTTTITGNDEFVLLASDGIWYASTVHVVNNFSVHNIFIGLMVKV